MEIIAGTALRDCAGGSAAHERSYASHSAGLLLPGLPDRRLRRTGIFINEGGYNRSAVIAHAKDALTAGGNAIELFDRDEEINNRMVQDVKEVFDVPVIFGGGTNIENAGRRLKYADGAIVGTCFEGGIWGGPVRGDAVKAYVDNVRCIES